jgi:hypothetical protein
MTEQQRREQREIQKIIGKYAGEGESPNRNTIIEPQGTTRLRATEQSIPARSLPTEWSLMPTC